MFPAAVKAVRVGTCRYVRKRAPEAEVLKEVIAAKNVARRELRR
jgi:ActR/RegA family two-component response regulator